jgi:hypothetical protein
MKKDFLCQVNLGNKMLGEHCDFVKCEWYLLLIEV